VPPPGAAESASRARRHPKEEFMSHKKTLLAVVTALGTIVLAGFVSVSLTANEPVSFHQNDRANHPPRSVSG
jgi:hypothetical protein